MNFFEPKRTKRVSKKTTSTTKKKRCRFKKKSRGLVFFFSSSTSICWSDKNQLSKGRLFLCVCVKENGELGRGDGRETTCCKWRSYEAAAMSTSLHSHKRIRKEAHINRESMLIGLSRFQRGVLILYTQREASHAWIHSNPVVMYSRKWLAIFVLFWLDIFSAF